MFAEAYAKELAYTQKDANRRKIMRQNITMDENIAISDDQGIEARREDRQAHAALRIVNENRAAAAAAPASGKGNTAAAEPGHSTPSAAVPGAGEVEMTGSK